MGPGIEQLRAMPALLGALLAECSEQEAQWKPSAERWSIVEVIGHLAHVEAHGFRLRCELILKEENPVLADYDPETFYRSGVYLYPNLGAALDSFENERSVSLDVLVNILPEHRTRTAVHAKLGPLTLDNLLQEWPFHDIGHLRQVAELVRAVKYYPNMGPWQKFYQVHP